MSITIEQELLAVTTRRQPKTAFVLSTMQAIRSQVGNDVFEQSLKSVDMSLAPSIFTKLTRLPVAVVVALIMLAVISLSGATYALVRYLPSLINVTSSTKTARGTQAYWAPAFTNCTANGTQKFERNKDAPQLSRTDVQKLIQARCEEDTIDSFSSHTWPTYGTNKVWKDGDKIYYARPDAIGGLQAMTTTSVTINESATSSGAKTYKAQGGQRITAYANGVQVPITSLKPHDTVYVIVRVSERYMAQPSQDQLVHQAQPEVVGVIGVVKLSQSLPYYGAMQNDLTEIPPCIGNPNDYCPNTASIDIYPRAGGEGAANPDLIHSTTNVGREISGTVLSLHDATLELKSSSGKTYTVNVPAHGFADYNTTYAPIYHDDSTLRVGSTVSVLYSQPSKANPQSITTTQVVTVRLLLDGDVKQENARQY